ncbi:MAG: LPS assembly lipoprotein LptE [Thermodesulfovibrionales bacterium]|nr:LPS assembly lipoprotein LptE [Thermodesulfovibrionales bacterium]
MKKTSILISLLLLSFLLIAASCGYGLHRQTRLDSVSIGRIENRTFEHGLEDRLVAALGDELMRNGIKLSDKSRYSIGGVINVFELRGIAQKGDMTVQYEVYIDGSFSLKGPEGESPLKTGELFPVIFSTEGPIEAVASLKEEAIARALRDIASKLAAAAVFR